MFHLDSFWYRPNEESSKDKGTSVDECLLVWLQSEPHDIEDRVKILRKVVKNIKWLAKKVDVSRILLHSFAHLGHKKADEEFSENIINDIEKRLLERDFEVSQVPFGEFNEFKMHVKGPSLAKVFKQL